MGRRPKLTREDCDDMRRMYADRTRNLQSRNLEHLFHVSNATVNKVLNGKYVPLEDHDEKMRGDVAGKGTDASMTQDECDDAVRWIMVVMEELVNAGFPSGDRTVQLANLRKLISDCQDEKRRADQLGINCQWLIQQFDRIHAALCPGQMGTWQQRVEQAVEAAETILDKPTKQKELDIKNLRFYAEMFGEHRWGTPQICWNVFVQTLNEIAERLESK